MALSVRLYESPVQPIVATRTSQLVLVQPPESPASDPPIADRRWSAPTRFAVILGCAVGCWVMIAAPLLLIWG